MRSGTDHELARSPAASAAELAPVDVQEPDARRRNKKDEVVRLAIADPFMSVDEIAVQVNTTPRYVRTILSEAGLSLLALRRRYARQMEQRLGLDIRVPRGGQGLVSALTAAANRLETRGIRVAQVSNPELAAWLEVPPNTPLLEISRVRVVNGRPLYVNQIVTSRHVTVDEAILTSNSPLREALGLNSGGRASWAERTLDVVPATAYLAESLHVTEGAPILRSGNVIRVGHVRVGIEFNYFDASRIRLVLEGVPDYALRIVERRETGGEGEAIPVADSTAGDHQAAPCGSAASKAAPAP